MKYIHKLKIIIVLVVALLVSSFLSSNVFIAGTPKLNTQFISTLTGSPLRLWTNTANYVASLGKKKAATSDPLEVHRQELVADGYTQTSKHSYEKVDVAAKAITVEVLPDTQFVQKEVTLDGKRVKIWLPAD